MKAHLRKGMPNRSKVWECKIMVDNQENCKKNSATYHYHATNTVIHEVLQLQKPVYELKSSFSAPDLNASLLSDCSQCSVSLMAHFIFYTHNQTCQVSCISVCVGATLEYACHFFLQITFLSKTHAVVQLDVHKWSMCLWGYHVMVWRLRVKSQTPKLNPDGNSSKIKNDETLPIRQDGHKTLQRNS
jgi:hypothetical protein